MSMAQYTSDAQATTTPSGLTISQPAAPVGLAMKVGLLSMLHLPDFAGHFDGEMSCQAVDVFGLENPFVRYPQSGFGDEPDADGIRDLIRLPL
jgi:hypothetical protein